MRLYHCLIIISGIVCLSLNTQRNPIVKKWRLVAEEVTYYNLDYTKRDGAKDRLDSIKNETVQFLPDGSFKSRDGQGTYTLSKDSIRLTLHGKSMSFSYKWSDAKLTMESDAKESRFIIRSKLYLE